MAEHLEVLRRAALRIGDAEAVGEGDALQGALFKTRDCRRRLEAQQIENGRRDVAGVAKLVTQLAAGGDATRPGDHERIANPAAVRVLLIALRGVLAAMAHPQGKFEWVSGPPMSSMRAIFSAIGSGLPL